MTDSKDLIERIERLGPRIRPALSDHDVERLVEGSRQRRRRKTVGRFLGVAALTGAAAVAGAVWVRGPSTPPVRVAATGATVEEPRPQAAAAAPPDPASVPRVVRFRDGSRALPLDGGAGLAVVADRPDRVSVQVERGKHRFEVVPSRERVFLVEAGEVRVRVVGTVFSVERIADRIGVAVDRGKVVVAWAGGERVLGVGESGWFPPIGEWGGAGAGAKTRTATRTRTREGEGTEGGAAGSAAVESSGEKSAPERLLVLADQAREQGKSAEAVELLRRLLREHRRDPRAPLAAFTLGRMLLMELGRPREAATAFAEARRLAPGGPFAEDALAREVEAWRKAGDADEARSRAREYLRLHPAGTRVEAVRALGGVE